MQRLVGAEYSLTVGESRGNAAILTLFAFGPKMYYICIGKAGIASVAGIVSMSVPVHFTPFGRGTFGLAGRAIL